MLNLSKELSKIFSSAIKHAYPILPSTALSNLRMTPIENNKIADYECTHTFNICNALKKQKFQTTPVECAKSIVEHVDKQNLIEDALVNEKGKIHIKLQNKQIQNLLSRVSLQPITIQQNEQTKKVIIDFSSPNIAKEMHVGHLRSTIIGDTLSRIFEFCGHNVIRVNHVGDWGTQFGMLISRLQSQYPDWATRKPSISDICQFYREAKIEFDKDESFRKQSLQQVVKLQQGDEDSLKAWRLLCEWSREEFQKIYDRLDIKIVERGESFYNPYIKDVINELNEKKLIKESEGLKCIFINGYQFPLIVEKSDGGYTYDTTDLAALWYRLNVEKGDHLIYVTDSGQKEHFEMIFEAGKLAGWVVPEKHIVDHVGFGVVMGEDKKKFKTREGEVTKLSDLLDEAKQRALEVIKMKDQERLSKDNELEPLSPEEMEHAAEVIGYGAAKYADLKTNRITNYVFSFDRMLDFRGNTAVYLLYAYARISSILRKANFQPLENAVIPLEHPKERKLAICILRFPEVIETVAQRLQPNLLCAYLYELSITFTEFYGECKVIGSPEQEGRLMLCKATHKVMGKCFELLGMKTLDRI